MFRVLTIREVYVMKLEIVTTVREMVYLTNFLTRASIDYYRGSPGISDAQFDAKKKEMVSVLKSLTKSTEETR